MIFLPFLAATHTSRVNSDEMDGAKRKAVTHLMNFAQISLLVDLVLSFSSYSFGLVSTTGRPGYL